MIGWLVAPGWVAKTQGGGGAPGGGPVGLQKRLGGAAGGVAIPSFCIFCFFMAFKDLRSRHVVLTTHLYGGLKQK